LADRLDGRPAQILDLSDSDKKPSEKIVAGTRDRPSAFPLRPQLKKNAQGAVEAPSRQPGKPAAGLPICTGKQKELLL
jgi:hypothetical protein